VVISTYVPYELYEKVKELARSKGKNISEVAYELIKRGLEASGAVQLQLTLQTRLRTLST